MAEQKHEHAGWTGNWGDCPICAELAPVRRELAETTAKLAEAEKAAHVNSKMADELAELVAGVRHAHEVFVAAGLTTHELGDGIHGIADDVVSKHNKVVAKMARDADRMQGSIDAFAHDESRR